MAVTLRQAKLRSSNRHPAQQPLLGYPPNAFPKQSASYAVLFLLRNYEKNEVTGEWRKLHNEELNELYCSPNIVRVLKSRRMKWAGHVARMEEGRGVYRVLVGKPEGKRPLGRPRYRWEDNIKMDLQEMGCEGVDWIELARDKDRCRSLVNAVMNLRVP